MDSWYFDNLCHLLNAMNQNEIIPQNFPLKTTTKTISSLLTVQLVLLFMLNVQHTMLFTQQQWKRWHKQFAPFRRCHTEQLRRILLSRWSVGREHKTEGGFSLFIQKLIWKYFIFQWNFRRNKCFHVFFKFEEAQFELNYKQSLPLIFWLFFCYEHN